MITSPTTASALASPARDKTFTIEAERRLKECQERLEQFTQRACARRGQPLGTKARPVRVTEYGVMTATPGPRVQVVAHQAEQVLAGAAVATVSLVASVTDRILSLPGWLVLVLVFAFPALEASAFVGFVFPGEIAVIMLGAGLSIRWRAALWSAAALVVLIVGASRIYLGAHWLTDVLAGYALGATWAAIVAAVLLTTSRGTGEARAVQEQGHALKLGHQHRRKAA